MVMCNVYCVLCIGRRGAGRNVVKQRGLAILCHTEAINDLLSNCVAAVRSWDVDI